MSMHCTAVSSRNRARGTTRKCHSLEALLVPCLAIDTVGGYLPAVGHILADLLGVAVPLAPLPVGLGCKAKFVLLQRGFKEEMKSTKCGKGLKERNTHTL